MTGQYANRFLSILYRYSQRYLAQELKRAGIALELACLPAMMQAYRHPGITQDGISGQAGMDKGTVARAVKRLEQQGLVARLADESDRRINHVFPTQRALEQYPHVQQAFAHLHEVLYRGLSDVEIEQTTALLQRMQENLAQHFERQGQETEREAEQKTEQE